MKEKEDEEIAEQLKELTKQLNYKEMYENEQKRCNKVEDQLREQYKQNADMHKQNADIYKQLLEKECLRNEGVSNVEKINIQSILEETKKEIAKSVKESEAAYKSEMLERDHLMDEVCSKQKVLTEKLNEEITKLKNQLTAYEKQWENHTNHCKELNAINEKRINKAIDTFNEQTKDMEAPKKALDNLQLKIEEFKEKEVTKLKNSEVAWKIELHDLQSKVIELNKGEAKKLEDTKGAYKKEVHNLQVKVEELRKEVTKTFKDRAEKHRKETLENKHVRDEESFEQKVTTEKLKEEIIQLKNQLNLLVYEQETEQEDLQFTRKLEDSIKRLCYKELNAREVMYEKRINKVTDIFNKQLTHSEETQRKQFDDLQCKIQNNLQLKIAEFQREVTKTIEDNAESQKKRCLKINI